MDYIISLMKETDWHQMGRVYQEGIDTNISTFESVVPDWEKWDRDHIPSCRLVVKRGEVLIGWAALSPYSKRRVYSGVAEVSIYIGREHRGQKIGENLLNTLIKISEEHGYWTLQSTIIEENKISWRLHKKCGFREVGTREKLAKTEDGKWHDVILMEHRSKIIE